MPLLAGLYFDHPCNAGEGLICFGLEIDKNRDMSIFKLMALLYCVSRGRRHFFGG